MEKQLTHQESLQIITEMIGNAKRNLANSGSFYFLLWGTIVAIANFTVHFMINYTSIDNWYYVWLITIPAIPITIIHARRQRSAATVSGPIDHFYGHIWIGVFICMVISLAFMSKISYAINPLMLIYSGIGTYLTGILSRYRPLLVGAVVLWISAIVIFLIPATQQFLVAGLGIVAGYIIPGLMLRKQEQ